MKSFKIPNALNGVELVDELLNAGVKLATEIGNYKDLSAPKIYDNLLWLDIADTDELKAAQVVENHKGTITNDESNILAKLESLGINVNDLKTVLGL